MRIAKPLLLVTTPIGLADGFYECYKLVGGMVFTMIAMVGVLGVALATVVSVVRREEKASRAAATASADSREMVCKS